MTCHLDIDGSQGEGGGQIIRSSLALALVTGRSFTITNIRAGREKPGLKRQHVAAVRAAAEVGRATVTGAAVGSQSLNFEPQTVQAGQYRFSVGTAGSATLVLQTVLPALLTADQPSELTLEGGTHNQWAPPFDFLEAAYLPLINRMGPHVTARLERHGFYPAGGGRFRVTIEPSKMLNGFELLERGSLTTRRVRALVANLPLHIAQREVTTALHSLAWDDLWGSAEQVAAHGPGNVVMIEVHSERVTEVFTAFGRLRARAEQVAEEAVEDAQTYLQSTAPVGPYLADQLVLPLGISAWQSPDASRRAGGSFKTLPLTAHATTHLDVLRQFLGIDIRVDTSPDDGTCSVHLCPPTAH
jgi:RNA 3'-terminal phosphate cyclase (ATP)